MSEGVLIALVGLLGSAIGSLCGMGIGIKLITYRIEQLEKRVEKHNNVIDRTYKLEGEVAVIKNEIKTTNHVIDELKER